MRIKENSQYQQSNTVQPTMVDGLLESLVILALLRHQRYVEVATQSQIAVHKGNSVSETAPSIAVLLVTHPIPFRFYIGQNIANERHTETDCHVLVFNYAVCANSTWNMYTLSDGAWICCESALSGSQ
jgi:hypothetical protein